MKTRDADALHAELSTPDAAGAVAIIEVWGPPEQLACLCRCLTKREPAKVGRLMHADLAGIDDGLVVRLTSTHAQFMPHGGPRVVQVLLQWLVDQGVKAGRRVGDATVDATMRFPEARDAVEAAALATIAKGVSPAAVDLLLRQSALWDRYVPGPGELDALRERAVVLQRLVVPPRVVVMGAPNAGKSTLLNRLLGREQAITSELAGTTRDHTQSLVLLRSALGGVHVRWLDTPGLRETSDPIEARAIELTRKVIAEADVLIALAAHDAPWPEAEALPREPDLRVWNKMNAATPSAEEQVDVHISANTGHGVSLLEHEVLRVLGLADLRADERWLLGEG